MNWVPGPSVLPQGFLLGYHHLEQKGVRLDKEVLPLSFGGGSLGIGQTQSLSWAQDVSTRTFWFSWGGGGG